MLMQLDARVRGLVAEMRDWQLTGADADEPTVKRHKGGSPPEPQRKIRQRK
jgi:hypothetical protein